MPPVLVGGGGGGGALHCADCQLGPYHESQEFHISTHVTAGVVEYLLEPEREQQPRLRFHKVGQELINFEVTSPALAEELEWQCILTWGLQSAEVHVVKH